MTKKGQNKKVFSSVYTTKIRKKTFFLKPTTY
jgi:hypothetical protein